MIPNWVRFDNGQWAHRPWWKVWINNLLRAVKSPWIIATVTDLDQNGTPLRVVGYRMSRWTVRNAS